MTLFSKEEMLPVLKHLSLEYTSATTPNKKDEALRETVALLTNYIGDAEIRVMITPIIIAK